MGGRIGLARCTTLVIGSLLLLMNCGDDKIIDEDNNPPAAPESPSPPNGATDQPLGLTLSWDCSDPEGDPLTYDVYFGISSNPPLVGSTADDSYLVTDLQANTTYYWRISAHDDHSHTTDGSIWSFSTGEEGVGFSFIGNIQLDGAEGIYVYNTYAYVTGFVGEDPDQEGALFIVDVSSPGSPELTSVYSPTAGDGIHVAPDPSNPSFLNAYIPNHRDGFTILDVTDPDNPEFAGIMTDFAGPQFTSCDRVDVKDGFAYLAYQDTGLVIVDISDRTNPTMSGRITDPDFSPRTLFVEDNSLYVVSGNPSNKVRAYDISDPANPSFTCEEPLTAGGYDSEIFVDNSYVYVTPEVWSDPSEFGLDIINRAGCSRLGTLATPGYSHGIFVAGNFAYLADYDNGLLAVDVSNPTNPVIAAHNPSPSNSQEVFVSSGYVFLTAEDFGLFIFRHNQ